MTNEEFNRSRRANDSYAYLVNYEDTVGYNPLLGNAVTDLKGFCDELNDINALQSEGSEHHTEGKYDHRAVTTFAFLAICVGLFDMGTKVQNSEVKVMGTKNMNYFRRKSEGKFIGACEAILKFARKFETGLLLYGIAPGQLDEAELKLESFRKWMSAPRKYVSTRSGGTRSVPRILAEISDLLEIRIDNVMRSYHRDYPDYVDGYFAVRMIQDLGLRHPGKKPGAVVTKGSGETK